MQRLACVPGFPHKKDGVVVVLFTYGLNQSGYEPLNLENGSFVNSDNFDATDLGLQSEGDIKVKAHWHCYEIVQNATIREYTRRCNTVENIHKVIGS